MHQLDLLDAADAAKLIGLSVAHMARLRMIGGGPTYIKLGSGRQGRIRYRRRDVDAWIESRARTSTSERAL